MSDERNPPRRPVFRSSNPYSRLVEAEEDAELAGGAEAPPEGVEAASPPGWWTSAGPPATGGWGRPVWTWSPPGARPPAATSVPPPLLPMPAARPTPARPPGRPHVATATVAVSLVVAGLLAVGLGALLVRATSHSAPAPATLLSPSAGASAPATAASAPSPTPSSTPEATSSPTPPPLSAAEIEARADPAIVDITATIPDQDIVAEGTGMIASPSGEVLTNDHVVDGASRISVLIQGHSRPYRARIVGVDRGQDVAVLQIDGAPSGLPTIAVGDSTAVATGDSVVLLGNAGGHGGRPVLSTGSVSALGQTVTATDASGNNAETLTDLIRIDARVEAGDSGAPLIDDQARVIGMVTAASARHAATPQGYAIPIATVVGVASQITGGTPAG